MEIKGKTVIITGATGRLASEIVLTMAKAGANCICIYHKNSARAKELQRKLTSASSVEPKTKSLFIRMDLTAAENIEKIFSDIEKFAAPQVLINAAAVFEKKLIEEITFEYVRKTLDVNFIAAMEMTRKFVKLVRKTIRQKQNLSSTVIGEPIAKIINIADIAAQRPPAGFSVYCASKAALIAATKSLAKELSPDFTVNAVAPGIINWPFDFAQGRHKDVTAKQKKKILAHIPAGRTGRPEEVAGAVKFLIENDYITGQIISIDGGRTI
jgi:NAD(P)-dependent dehydrogenase (short-subunit alcohol dehydrogenase family)